MKLTFKKASKQASYQAKRRKHQEHNWALGRKIGVADAVLVINPEFDFSEATIRTCSKGFVIDCASISQGNKELLYVHFKQDDPSIARDTLQKVADFIKSDDVQLTIECENHSLHAMVGNARGKPLPNPFLPKGLDKQSKQREAG